MELFFKLILIFVKILILILVLALVVMFGVMRYYANEQRNDMPENRTESPVISTTIENFGNNKIEDSFLTIF